MNSIKALEVFLWSPHALVFFQTLSSLVLPITFVLHFFIYICSFFIIACKVSSTLRKPQWIKCIIIISVVWSECSGWVLYGVWAKQQIWLPLSEQHSKNNHKSFQRFNVSSKNSIQATAKTKTLRDVVWDLDLILWFSRPAFSSRKNVLTSWKSFYFPVYKMPTV